MYDSTLSIQDSGSELSDPTLFTQDEELDLTGIDDDEIDTYIMTEREDPVQDGPVDARQRAVPQGEGREGGAREEGGGGGDQGGRCSIMSSSTG